MHLSAAGQTGPALNPGDTVWWYDQAKPGGWHAGRYVRTIARGKDKGRVEVETGGTLLPRRRLRIDADRLRVRPGA